MELFLNRVWASLAAGMDSAQTSMPLTAGHGARFGTIGAGDKVRVVLLDASLNVSEIVYATARSGDTLTVIRGQDGTVGVAHLAGDRVEHRVGKSTMDSLTQKAKAGTDAIAETHAATSKATPIDADELPLADSAATFGLKRLTWANLKATLLSTWKDTTGGLVGLTLFKINFRNAANTITSFFTNSNTAARTYTFQDRNGTILDNLDITGCPRYDQAAGQNYTQSPASGDLNLCIQAGDYNFADTATNKPAGITGWGFLHVSRHVNTASGAVYVHQIAMDMNGGNPGAMYSRRGVPAAGYTCTWSTWARIVAEDGIAAAINITGNAASVSGSLGAGVAGVTQNIKDNSTKVATTQYVDRDGNFWTQTSGSFVTPVAGFYKIVSHGGGGPGNAGGYAGTAGAFVSALYYLPAGFTLTLAIGAGGPYNGANGGTTTVTGTGVSVSATGGVNGGQGLYTDGQDAKMPDGTTWPGTGGDYDNNEGSFKDGQYGGGGCNANGGTGTGAGGTGYVHISWGVGPGAV